MSEPDWADQRANEWLEAWHRNWALDWRSQMKPQLAALLREQKAGYANAEMGAAELHELGRQHTLAEVRHVVEEIGQQKGRGVGSRDACDAILKRLEAL